MTDTARPKGRPRSAAVPAEPTVQALDRAIALLELVAARPGLTLSDLAQQTGQPIASTYRALVTLQARGMVEIEEPGASWHIGPAAFRLGAAFRRRSGLEARARPILAALAAELGETASLGIESDGRLLVLAQAEAVKPIRATFPPGSFAPLNAAAAGKAILAHTDADRVEEIIDLQGLPRETSLTITSPDTLLRELSRIRERGFALDDQEQAEGMRAVAAPVFDARGLAIAAIAVTGPAFRFGLSDATRLGPRLAAEALRLTDALGGSAPD